MFSCCALLLGLVPLHQIAAADTSEDTVPVRADGPPADHRFQTAAEEAPAEMPLLISDPDFVVRGGLSYSPGTLVDGTKFAGDAPGPATVPLGKVAVSAEGEASLRLGEERTRFPVRTVFTLGGKWYTVIEPDADPYEREGVPVPQQRYTLQGLLQTPILQSEQAANSSSAAAETGPILIDIGTEIEFHAGIGAALMSKTYDATSVEQEDVDPTTAVGSVARLRLKMPYVEVVGSLNYAGANSIEPTLFVGLRNELLLYMTGAVVGAMLGF